MVRIGGERDMRDKEWEEEKDGKEVTNLCVIWKRDLRKIAKLEKNGNLKKTEVKWRFIACVWPLPSFFLLVTHPLPQSRFPCI